LIGLFTAIVAFLVDVAEATISDYKVGFCSSNPFRNKEQCCTRKSPLFGVLDTVGEDCSQWKMWSDFFWGGFGIYIGFAVLFGVVAGAVTMTTAANLPAASQDDGKDHFGGDEGPLVGKSMYMAAGSGIPEIKTILSGFVIPHFLDFKVLLVKAIGATFAVATGMCLGKEGPLLGTQGRWVRGRGEGIGDQYVFLLKLRKEGSLRYSISPFMCLHLGIT
jgi:chloride channel 3/4/5